MDYQKIEQELLEELKKEIENNLRNLGNPNVIFFVSWTFTNAEGRLACVWQSKKTGLEILEIDKDRLKLIKIWSFIFPEMREDYLVEKVWNLMKKDKERTHLMKFHFCNDDCGGGNNNEYHIENTFRKSLKGENLKKKIDECSLRLKNLQDTALLLKVARILKYDKDFNKSQIEGINKGFGKWISYDKQQKTRKSIDCLFRALYEKENPACHPLEARKFLTMWQNFSVIFSDMSYAVLGFYVPDATSNPDLRYAIGLFYKERGEGAKDKKLISILKKVTNNLPLKKQTEQRVSQNHSDSLWSKVRDQYKGLWDRKIVPQLDDKTKLDNLIELAGRLAFSTHEARPCKFAFIAGTEQIWPAIEEIISLDFYTKEEMLTKNNFKAELFARLCEANYSIFQIDGVAGFYNIKSQTMSKIIRLGYPTKEDLRLLEDSICDLDDFFCWTITKIFKETCDVEKAFIIYTHGNGKVSIYGLDEKNVGNLILIWDIKRGELYEPIAKEILQKITDILKKININEESNEYRKLIKAIRKISAIPGEGAAIIIHKQGSNVAKYLAPMEPLKPTWLEALDLYDPQYLLKASFIMDGACEIAGEKKVKSRLAIYPHYCGSAWSILLGSIDQNLLFELTGKGSKTHASANLTTIPDNIGKVFVISISADGPVKVWPRKP